MREEKKAEKRQELVDVCLDCFVEKGLTVATTKDLCKAAKLQNGGIYYYFSTKEEIVLACAEEAISRIEKAAFAIVLEDIRDIKSMMDHLGELADASAPFADGMAMAGILGLPMAFLAAGIAFGGDFSTLNSSIAVPPRYLFAMAREGSMPKVFARLHPRYQTPWVSILFLGALSLVLVFYPITFVASVSLFADLFYYIIGIAAALGLRKRHPELGRPYKAPLIEVGVPVSILIYAIMLFQLDRYAIVSGIIWCVVGLVVYYICHAKYGDSNILNINDSITDEAPPSPEERAKMDKEYLLWKSIVAAFCIIAVLLYVIPLIF